jgi:PleD family two-component response regulator
MGLTAFTKNDSADDIFRRADEALYEAKGSGKNKICYRE